MPPVQELIARNLIFPFFSRDKQFNLKQYFKRKKKLAFSKNNIMEILRSIVSVGYKVVNSIRSVTDC